jgi:hypothetical protein
VPSIARGLALVRVGGCFLEPGAIMPGAENDFTPVGHAAARPLRANLPIVIYHAITLPNHTPS